MLGVVCGLVMLEGDLGHDDRAGGDRRVGLLHGRAPTRCTSSARRRWQPGVLGDGQDRALPAEPDRRLTRPVHALPDAGWQPVHGLYALGSGGLFGVGLGRAARKFMALTSAHRHDLRGDRRRVRPAGHAVHRRLLPGDRLPPCGSPLRRHRDRFGAAGDWLTAWLVFQALINMAVVTTLLPFTELVDCAVSGAMAAHSLVMCWWPPVSC